MSKFYVLSCPFYVFFFVRWDLYKLNNLKLVYAMLIFKIRILAFHYAVLKAVRCKFSNNKFSVNYKVTLLIKGVTTEVLTKNVVDYKYWFYSFQVIG